MKKIVSLVCLLLCLAPISYAQVNIYKPLVDIRIVPTNGLWDYKINEPIKMEVSVEKNEIPINNITITYNYGPEMITPVKSGEVTIKNKSVVIDCGKMTVPGFWTLNVKVKVDGREYSEWKTVGVERDKIKPTVALPSDFVSYWDNQLKQLANIPMKSEMTLIPERCTNDVNVYNISYQCNAQGSRMYGVLCVPKAPGKYPAILYVPGAGVRPYNGVVKTAAKGFITLEVGIHGIPVNMDTKVYDAIRIGALNRYWSMNVEDKDNYYYNRVYKGCKRGVDFIFELPEFDGKNIGTWGGSQGGALSVIVSALDPRITCAVSAYPALSDLTGYLHNRAGGWPHIMSSRENGVYNKKEVIENLSYYDVVNFAKQIKCPIHFTMGYNDKVCPPTTTFSVYNVVTSPKELNLVYEIGHWRYPEQDIVSEKYMIKHLK